MTSSGLPPVSRPTDPIPSFVGEVEITARGRRQSQVQAIIRYVRAHPGSCRGEIATGLGMDEYGASKRLSDAKNIGMIYGLGAVHYRARLQSQWWPVLAQGRLL